MLSSSLVALVLLVRPTDAFFVRSPRAPARPPSPKGVVRMAVMDGVHPTRRSILAAAAAAAAPAAALLSEPAAGHAADPVSRSTWFTASIRSCQGDITN